MHQGMWFCCVKIMSHLQPSGISRRQNGLCITATQSVDPFQSNILKYGCAQKATCTLVLLRAEKMSID